MRITSEECGLEVDVPSGWSARIWNRLLSQPDERVSNAIHVGNFVLPSEDGTFGDRAASLMVRGDAFFVLAERGGVRPYEGIYESRVLPVDLDLAGFGETAMQAPYPGLLGRQYFLTLGERPFCLMVVLGGTVAFYEHKKTLVSIITSIAVTPADEYYGTQVADA